MAYRSDSLIDWLLLRAWVEPDHEQKLRVVIRSPARRRGEPEAEQAFANADGAAAFVRTWLRNLVRRWEAGERYQPEAHWGPEPDDDSEEDCATEDERD